MVIHIGMELAAGICPSGSPAARLRTPVRRDSNWRNRTVARPKSLAETPETSETSKTSHFWAFETASPPRRKPAETSLPHGRTGKILLSIRCERIILRGVLAVQSRES